MRGLFLFMGLTLAGCSMDLFHSTSWASFCDENPGAEVCDQEDSGTDSESGGDSSNEAGVTKDASPE